VVEKNLRCNEQIRISPIRLIDENNQQIGIVDLKEGLAQAREVGLDLVEVAPQSRPPVCRILDYGKWKYSQQKKEQKAKAKRHEAELKEIRIRTPRIGEHDLGIKINHAREFLERGDRVQFTLRFRGRELAHVDEGERVFEQIRACLADVSKIERGRRREGRQITMVLTSAGKKPSKESAPHKAEA